MEISCRNWPGQGTGEQVSHFEEMCNSINSSLRFHDSAGSHQRIHQNPGIPRNLSWQNAYEDMRYLAWPRWGIVVLYLTEANDRQHV